MRKSGLMLFKNSSGKFAASPFTLVFLFIVLIFLYAIDTPKQTKKNKTKRRRTNKIRKRTQRLGKLKKQNQKTASIKKVIPPKDFILKADKDRLDDFGIRLPELAHFRLGSTLLNHGGAINGLHFSPDGKTIISTGMDKTISFWNILTGKEMHRTTCNEIPGSISSTSNTEEFFYKDYHRNIFHFVSYSNYQESQTVISKTKLENKFKSAQNIAFSKNKRLFATFTKTGTQLWNKETMEQIFLFPSHAQPAVARFLENDTRLSILHPDGILFVWDLTSKKIIEKKQIPSFKVFQPDKSGKLVLIQQKKKVQIYNLLSGALTTEIPIVGPPYAFSNNGNLLAIGNNKGKVTIWDLKKEKEKITQKVSTSYANALAFSPDDQTLSLGNNAGYIHIFETATLNETSDHRFHRSTICNITFSPDGKFLYSLSTKGKLIKWDLTTQKQVLNTILGIPCALIRFVAQDKLLVVTMTSLKLINAHDLSVLKTQKYPSGRVLFPSRAPAAFSNSSNKVATALLFVNFLAGKPKHPIAIKVFDTNSLKEESEIPIKGKFCGLALSPEGKHLAYTTLGKPHEQKIYSFDLSTGKQEYSVPIPTKISRPSFPFYMTEDQMIVGGGSYSPKRYDRLAPNEDTTIYLAKQMGIIPGSQILSPDRKYLANADWQDRRTIKLGQPPYLKFSNRSFSGHRGYTSALAFSPGGRYLASAGNDGSILLWDIKNKTANYKKKIRNFFKRKKKKIEKGHKTEPIISFQFEDYVGSSSGPKVFIASGASGNCFITGFAGKALQVSSKDFTPIKIASPKTIDFPNGWTAEFRFKIPSEYTKKKGTYLEVIKTDLFSFTFQGINTPYIYHYYENSRRFGSCRLARRKKLNQDMWHHVALVREPVKRRFIIYLNGKKVISKRDKKMSTQLTNFSFGRGVSRNYDYRINIDNFEIYDYPKSSKDIAISAGFAESPNQTR